MSGRKDDCQLLLANILEDTDDLRGLFTRVKRGGYRLVPLTNEMKALAKSIKARAEALYKLCDEFAQHWDFLDVEEAELLEAFHLEAVDFAKGNVMKHLEDDLSTLDTLLNQKAEEEAEAEEAEEAEEEEEERRKRRRI